MNKVVLPLAGVLVATGVGLALESPPSCLSAAQAAVLGDVLDGTPALHHDAVSGGGPIRTPSDPETLKTTGCQGVHCALQKKSVIPPGAI